MPQKGDTFTAMFKTQAPLSWGTNRSNEKRDPRPGERYIPIPRQVATRLGIHNSNAGEGLGLNLFNAHSTDNQFEGILKAAGSSEQGDIYAKQFEGNKNLKMLTAWLDHHEARVGDEIEMVWTSPTDIEMRFIAHH